MVQAALRETAYAKINLALHVRERLSDGYHRIETIFAFAQDGDELSVARADDLSLQISGEFSGEISDGSDNLVIRAAKALKNKFSIDQGAAITLEKKLPVASGIGGGSADAAATIRLLTQFWKISPQESEIREISSMLGADVPACILSKTCRGDGVGDELRRLEADSLSDIPVLLVNPGDLLETATVFANWDGEDRGSLVIEEHVSVETDWRNDLEAPARELVPEIGEVIEILEQQKGVMLAKMSGSGATCFALFEHLEARDLAANTVAEAFPAWWMLRSTLR